MKEQYNEILEFISKLEDPKKYIHISDSILQIYNEENVFLDYDFSRNIESVMASLRIQLMIINMKIKKRNSLFCY